MASYLCGLAGKSLARKASLFQPIAAYHGTSLIGKREVVGHGMNGEAFYVERPDYPMPAIRFKEDTPEVTKLRVKEKDDWKKLTLEEKKTLYRSSFRQTYSEYKAPTGEWKFVFGGIFLGCSFAIWALLWLNRFVYPPLPYSMTPEHQQKMLMKMLDLRVDPIDGLSSKYDYENKKWK